MTARTTMASLITKVRGLIGDPSGASAHFTDDLIQTALDARNIIVRHELLGVIETPTSTGTAYKDYFSEPFYEDTATLEDSIYAAFTATTKDYVNGRFTFATDTDRQQLYISGVRYDLYNAAADLMEDWIVSLKTLIDFTAAGSTFHQTQQIENMEKTVKRLRSKSRVTSGGTVYISRGDTDL